VTADVFCGRVDDDVRAEVNRPHQTDANGVVHDQRHAGVVGDLGQRLEVRHVELRVPNGLGVEGARLRCDGFAELIGLP